MEASKEKLIEQGFSLKVAKKIVNPQAQSTLKIYQSKWDVYVRWCESLQKDPHVASPPQLADFLQFKFEEGLAFKTLEGYRTAIAGALKIVTGKDLGHNEALSALLHHFQRERPPASMSFPPWDLSFVLFSLAGKAFEPINSIPLNLLTYKTVFLLLLASGARRGELHAIDYKASHNQEEWQYVTLVPHQDFVSKTQLLSRGASTLERLVIPRLRGMGSDLPKDKALCPVRCLKCYLAKTERLRKNRKLLFIPLKENVKGDIAKSTISSWMRKLLRYIYNLEDKDALELTGRTTHHIRKCAASLAFRGQIDTDKILEACSWKAHTTFTDKYLKNVCQNKDGFLQLGPIVAAQHVVQPSKLV